jgi:hypothetical protein
VPPILSECACADRTFRFVAARTSYARVRHERACATCFIVLYARTTCDFSCVCAHARLQLMLWDIVAIVAHSSLPRLPTTACFF